MLHAHRVCKSLAHHRLSGTLNEIGNLGAGFAQQISSCRYNAELRANAIARKCSFALGESTVLLFSKQNTRQDEQLVLLS